VEPIRRTVLDLDPQQPISAVQTMEGYLRETMMSGRRYIPRLPPVHKKIVKELDYQIRAVDQGYRKIRKIWEKGKVPKQLDTIESDVKEIVQRSDQLKTLVAELEELEEQQKETIPTRGIYRVKLTVVICDVLMPANITVGASKSVSESGAKTGAYCHRISTQSVHTFPRHRT